MSAWSEHQPPLPGPAEARGIRAKERLDQLLVRRGLAESRAEAQRLILAGLVRVAGETVDKAGRSVPAEVPIDVKPTSHFVSRGGAKLAHALETFGLRVEGRVCLDVGASTGGFTHCLLERGARLVCAVDVGHGKLDVRLRNHPRVVVMEKMNARQMTPETFPEPSDLATIDVSFISLEKVLPPVFGVLTDSREVVALVKPQFEVGRRQVGKGGVVRDPALHQAVVQRLACFAALMGWNVLGVTPSPLRGPKGNREFFLHLSLLKSRRADLEALIAQVVHEGGQA
ncbi:MAG: TlyA family RNA methyltransferase [Candidatus Methylomirabilia bacterium]